MPLPSLPKWVGRTPRAHCRGRGQREEVKLCRLTSLLFGDDLVVYNPVFCFYITLQYVHSPANSLQSYNNTFHSVPSQVEVYWAPLVNFVSYCFVSVFSWALCGPQLPSQTGSVAGVQLVNKYFTGWMDRSSKGCKRGTWTKQGDSFQPSCVYGISSPNPPFPRISNRVAFKRLSSENFPHTTMCQETSISFLWNVLCKVQGFYGECSMAAEACFGHISHLSQHSQSLGMMGVVVEGFTFMCVRSWPSLRPSLPGLRET